MQRRVDASGVPVGGRPLALVTASITCPVAVRTCPHVEALQDAVPEGVRAAIVYIGEAHPRAGGPTAAAVSGKGSVPTGHGAYAAPRTLEERLALARLFRRHLKLDAPVYVDGMDHAFRKMMGSGPNSAFLVDPRGVLQLKQGWYAPAGLPAEVCRLMASSEGRPPPRSYTVADTGSLLAEKTRRRK